MQVKLDIIPVIRNLNHWPRFRLLLFAEGAWVGLLSGIIISFFRWTLDAGTQLREYIYTILVNAGPVENGLWFLLLLAVAALLAWLKKIEPEASGSNVI